MYKRRERDGGKEEREDTTGCTQVESEEERGVGIKKERDGDKEGRGDTVGCTKGEREREIERRKERYKSKKGVEMGSNKGRDMVIEKRRKETARD